MDRMAEFLMTMAVEHAREQGVPSRYVIRHGNFDTEMETIIKEEQAALVVLGRPGDEESHFALEHLQELAGKLQEQTGVPICILPECSR
jgi:nucleotide-binding universal stress UspA family protein